jgi:hypothetical protein
MASRPTVLQHRRRCVIATAVLLLACIAAPTTATAASSTETITMNWTRSGTGDTPPFQGTGTGTFKAIGAVTDTGKLTLNGQDVAPSSPVLAAAWTDRLLASKNGTLELRCFQQATDFSNFPKIPFTGSCSIVTGTGVYSTLRGHGDFTTAVVNASTGKVSETLVLDVT